MGNNIPEFTKSFELRYILTNSAVALRLVEQARELDTAIALNENRPKSLFYGSKGLQKALSKFPDPCINIICPTHPLIMTHE